jgi:hypothetical protein
MTLYDGKIVMVSINANIFTVIGVYSMSIFLSLFLFCF